MLEAKCLAGLCEIRGNVAGAVVGHDPFDRDAEAFIITRCSLQKRDGAFGLLVWEDVGKRDARGVVYADMDVFLADATRIALVRPVTGDPVADPLEATKALDIEMDQAAWLGILIAHNGFGWSDVFHPGQVSPLENAADGGGRYTCS